MATRKDVNEIKKFNTLTEITPNTLTANTEYSYRMWDIDERYLFIFSCATPSQTVTFKKGDFKNYALSDLTLTLTEANTEYGIVVESAWFKQIHGDVHSDTGDYGCVVIEVGATNVTCKVIRLP